MSVKRPEGLSPAMGSLLTPYIYDGRRLKWKHRGGAPQTSASVRLKNESGTLLQSFEVLGDNLVIDQFSQYLLSGERYKWDVRTSSAEGVSPWSEEAEFVYDDIETRAWFQWSQMPQKDEQVSRNEVFSDLKDSLISIATDYVGRGVEDEWKYISMANNLFLGDVVPSRKDFEELKEILAWLGQSKENAGSAEVTEWIENGLGITDILRIRSFIDGLQAQPPATPTGFSVDATPPTLPQVKSLSGYVTGAGDKDVTVSWTTDEMAEWDGLLRLTGPSSSEDVSYYELILRYGNSNETVDHQLFYHEDTLKAGIPFVKDLSQMFDGGGSANFTALIRAIDKRGNMSHFSVWTKRPTGAAPSGIIGIELQWNKENQTAWNWVFNSSPLSGTTTNHYIGEQNMKFRYRARTVDVSGLRGEWFVSQEVNLRGLLPPGPPRDTKWGSTKTTIKLWWNAGLYADGYEIRIRTGATGTWSSWLTKGEHNREHENVDRQVNTEYHYEIRSYNAAGRSSAVFIKAKTKNHEEETVNFVASRNGQSWRTDYKSYYSMVPGGWRKDTTDVIQGRWEYEKNTYDDWDMDGKKDDWVLKGMHNGNHRGLWFFDHNEIRRALSGKRIKSAYLYVRRKESEHGWPKDATPIYLWTHNYSSPPSGVPQLGSSTNTRVKLDRGQSAWIPVPVLFIERIKEGSARGFAVYKENVGPQYDLSYQRFYSQASLRVTYYND